MTASVVPLSQPGTRRNRAGSRGLTTSTRVSRRPDDAARLPPSSPGSVRTSAVSGTSGYAERSTSIATPVVTNIATIATT
jgi:hypothetical protein